MDMEKHDYINAVDWFADIWEAVSQRASETASDPDQSAAPESDIYTPIDPNEQ